MTTATVSQNAEQQQRVREAMERQPRLLLGERSSHELEKDPRHLLFVLSRYKFVAKMLADRGRVLEVGIGDGLGASLVAQAGNTVIGIDLETLGLDHAADTRWTRERMRFAQHDMVAGPFVTEGGLFDGGYTLDVIEHIDPAQERLFLENIVRSLRPEAPLIVGTPNEAAKAYAFEGSARAAHQLEELPKPAREPHAVLPQRLPVRDERRGPAHGLCAHVPLCVRPVHPAALLSGGGARRRSR